MATLVPIQSPTQSLHFQRLHCSSRRWSKVPSTTFIVRAPIIIIKANKPIPLCSPLSASLLEEDSPPSPSLDESSIEDAVQLPLSGCKACGREKLENGCNGEGRIQGGIATVPGFGWWPIKAFRPCPGFVESGGRYRRRGQSMDEVAWGRGEREVSMVSTDEVQSSKKSQSSSPRRFKR